MKALRVNGGGEFISIKLKTYYQQQDIAIEYVTFYLYEDNGLVERGRKILITKKDSLLIDSSLPNNFWAEAIETANYL